MPLGPIWLLPLLILLMAALGLGSGIVVSSMTTRYRDLRYLVQFGVQLLMFSTPVICPLSKAPGGYRWIMLANPMTPVIETFRYAFLGTGTFSWEYLSFFRRRLRDHVGRRRPLLQPRRKTFMDTV